MNEFAVLTNRKRAIIALVHSVFFLLLAMRGVTALPILPLWLRIHEGLASGMVLLIIYLAVTAILLQLTRVSRCSIERLYFAFCSTSAGVGLLRAIFGDHNMHAGAYVRVLMLSCAVVTGFMILKVHSEPELAD